MTRPTDIEVAALLRELEALARRHSKLLTTSRYPLLHIDCADRDAERARAMAEKLQPTQEQS